MIKLLKILSILLFAAFVITMPSMFAHDAVTYAEWGTPVIDGVKDEVWNTAQMIEVKDPSIGTTDANTATGKVWSLWDGDYLYFYAEIKDPIIDAIDKENPWDQDAVGFMIDFAYDRTPEKSFRDLGGDSYAGYVNVAPIADNTTKNYPENPSIFGIASYADGTESRVKIVDSGYIIEIAIPLLYKNYVAGDKIGYEICINNGNGNNTREGQTVWMFADGANGDQSWQYTHNMGTLILNEQIIPIEVIENGHVESEKIIAPVTAPQTNDNIIIMFMLIIISGIAIVGLKKNILVKK